MRALNALVRAATLRCIASTYGFLQNRFVYNHIRITRDRVAGGGGTLDEVWPPGVDRPLHAPQTAYVLVGEATPTTLACALLVWPDPVTYRLSQPAEFHVPKVNAALGNPADILSKSFRLL